MKDHYILSSIFPLFVIPRKQESISFCDLHTWISVSTGMTESNIDKHSVSS